MSDGVCCDAPGLPESQTSSSVSLSSAATTDICKDMAALNNMSEKVEEDHYQGFSRQARKFLSTGTLLPNVKVSVHDEEPASASRRRRKPKHRRSNTKGSAKSFSDRRATTHMRHGPSQQNNAQRFGPSRSRTSKARRNRNQHLSVSLQDLRTQSLTKSIVVRNRDDWPNNDAASKRISVAELCEHKSFAGPHSQISQFQRPHEMLQRLTTTEQLDHIPSPKPKVAAIGRPSVWAETRQELCEGVPYFRAYQSGLYSHHNVAIGYLLDGFGSPRDHIGNKVVISHGGGKCNGRITPGGMYELAGDQSSHDKSVSALLNNYRMEQPLVLILGSKATSAPSIVPHRYCVLDWFRISHVWTERESDSNNNIRYKFRFEKLTNGDGWWSTPSTDSHDTHDPDQSPAPIKQSWCRSCNTTSPVVYQVQLCLNQSCPRYWNLGWLSSTQLILNDSIKEFFHQSNITPPCSIKPPISQSKQFYSGDDVSRICWRGICCPDCGKLNCRVLWGGWRCSNCDFTLFEGRKVYGISEIRDPFRPVYTGPPLSFDWTNPLSLLSSHVKSSPTIRTTQYHFGDTIGSVFHIACADADNSLANQLLENYQTEKVDFRRRPLKTKVDGSFLSAQFSHNAGVQYKYHADTGTEPFERCASVITKAKELIQERVATVIASQEFNEVLSIAYFDGQHMSYHDDGETGVAPVVASLSLGSTATMKFRPKRGHENLLFPSVTKFVPNEEIESGPPNVDEGADESITRSAPRRDVLRLHLEHGDVMIMAGANFQRFVEHAVVPKGFRIAATARHIS